MPAEMNLSHQTAAPIHGIECDESRMIPGGGNT